MATLLLPSDMTYQVSSSQGFDDCLVIDSTYYSQYCECARASVVSPQPPVLGQGWKAAAHPLTALPKHDSPLCPPSDIQPLHIMDQHYHQRAHRTALVY